MSMPYVLSLADSHAVLETVGGKGMSLAKLSNAGLPVPEGFHVTTAAYRAFVQANELQPGIMMALRGVDANRPDTLDSTSNAIRALFAHARMPADIAEAIRGAYVALGSQSPVAVRSSATAEDLPGASFAGQQESYLNVCGADAVLAAVQKCWASLWTARAIAYRARQHIAPESVALAVLVQELVCADAAGIVLTMNPVDGKRDEAVINATWGLGEAIVGGLVTGDILTVVKGSGVVVARQTAEKQVMTVRLEEGTAEQPVPEKLRRAPVLNDRQAAELVRLGTQIEQLYGMPVDIEWTLAKGAFAILQARPITALPEPKASAPSEWKLPKGAYAAMRNNIVELMAGPLTPLFGTLGRAAINTSLQRVMNSVTGVRNIMPEEIIIAVNGYAYNNGSLSAGQIVRLLWNSVGIAKTMFAGAVERWTETGRPRCISIVKDWRDRPWREFTAVQLLGAARTLTEAAIDAYGALIAGVIPAAWISEGLFTAVYTTLVKRRSDPLAPTYLLGFDSIPILAEKSLYDLAGWASTRPGLADYLSGAPAAQLAAQLGDDQSPSSVTADDWREWLARFRTHLDRYGHTIYTLDFSNPVPADDPAPLLATFKLYLGGRGTNPYERQQAAAARREQATEAALSRLKGLRLRLFRRFLTTARRYAPLREDGLAEVGLGYPLLRQMFLELGRRLVSAGVIDQPDHIFWLEQGELEQAAARIDRGEPLCRLAALVPQRKAAWRAAARTAPPLALPRMKVGGVDLMELRSGRAGKWKRDTLKGVAASPGRVTAGACVLHGPEDFSTMQPGSVLVAPITTPAWTPLFAMASAIVTDIGGPLSHGSIVAREYGIPAVLGTVVATERIRSGQQITVDGSAGTVTLVQTGESSIR